MNRAAIYRLLHYNPRQKTVAPRLIGLGIQTLIFLNVLAVILESVVWIRDAIGVPAFLLFEHVSLGVFFVEYILRVWTCVEDERFAKPWQGRARYIFTPLALIDLMAIMPIFLGGAGGLRILRMMRMIRLLRLAKMARYSRSLMLLGRVIKKRKEELISSLFIFVVLVILTAAFAYYAEGEAQPEVFSSIPAAMWWAVITFTTVGYGDVVPVTIWGKIIAMATSVLGIAMFGLVAGVLVTGFMSEFRIQQRKQVRPKPANKEGS